MKKIVMISAIGLLLSSGPSLAQDRRHHQNHGSTSSRNYHHQPRGHSHSHSNRSWLGPAIIGGLGLGYGLYQYNQYNNPPPAYYEPPVYVYPEVKVWDSYCGCYRIVQN